MVFGVERLHGDPRSTEELFAIAVAGAQALRQNGAAAGPAHNAVLVLQARGSHAVFEGALKLCGAATPAHRQLAALILGQLGSPLRTFPSECLGALLRLIRDDEDAEVVAEAVFVLGQLGDRGCVAELAKLCNHPDERVRHGVAFTLARLQAVEAADVLMRLMDDPHTLTRDWATTAISGMRSLDGPEIRDALLRRCRDEDPLIRAAAMEGLALRGDRRALGHLLADLQAESEPVYRFIDAAKIMVKLLSDKDREKGVLVKYLEQTPAQL